ncbi:hypothetical protein Poly59_38790 [Rubripirellula reticaptiva]|uniref:HEAT repeat protein n=1 Tax=Rubripirellula reticaptiva TaxID=2528013 RepID=A0A5C6ELD0_9BACT|nr:hypothetical protein Poly59_38790 [Rubripirellula reticaptiva]
MDRRAFVAKSIAASCATLAPLGSLVASEPNVISQGEVAFDHAEELLRSNAKLPRCRQLIKETEQEISALGDWGATACFCGIWNEDPSVRILSINCCLTKAVHVHLVQYVDLLPDILDHDDLSIRRCGPNLLWKMESKAHSAIPKLKQKLSDPETDPFDRILLAKAIAIIQPSLRKYAADYVARTVHDPENVEFAKIVLAELRCERPYLGLWTNPVPEPISDLAVPSA